MLKMDQYQLEVYSFLVEAFDALVNPVLPVERLAGWQMDVGLIHSGLKQKREKARNAVSRRNLDRLLTLSTGFLYSIDKRLEKAAVYE